MSLRSGLFWLEQLRPPTPGPRGAARVASSAWSDDGWGYTEAKTGVILDLLELATNWARATGWAPFSCS